MGGGGGRWRGGAEGLLIRGECEGVGLGPSSLEQGSDVPPGGARACEVDRAWVEGSQALNNVIAGDDAEAEPGFAHVLALEEDVDFPFRVRGNDLQAYPLALVDGGDGACALVPELQG